MTWREPLADSRRQRGWHLLGAAIRRRRLSLRMDAARARGRVRHRPDRDQPHRERQAVRPSMVALGGARRCPGRTRRARVRGQSAAAATRFATPEPRPRIDLVDGADEPIGDDDSDGDDARSRRTALAEAPNDSPDARPDRPRRYANDRHQEGDVSAERRKSSIKPPSLRRARARPGATAAPARRTRPAPYQAVVVAASVMPWASSQRSASMAALQPSPAAVTAWR